MTEQTQSVDVSVNNLIRMMQNQLTNTLNMIETQAPLIADSLNSETDEYNHLCDEIESAQNELLLMRDKLINSELSAAELKSQIDDLHDVHKSELNRLRQKISDLEVFVEAGKRVSVELKQLQALNPDRLKKRNSELSKTIKERTDALGQLKSKFNATNKQLTALTQKHAELERAHLKISLDAARMQEKLQHHDGDVLKGGISGQDGLKIYVHTFEWGLQYFPHNKHYQILQDLDFHIELRTNIAIGVIVSITEWLQPFYPPCTELVEMWPEDGSVHEVLCDLIRLRCLETHAILVDRVDWATSLLVDEISVLSPEFIEACHQRGHHSAYDLAIVVPERLSQTEEFASLDLEGEWQRAVDWLKAEFDRQNAA